MSGPLALPSTARSLCLYPSDTGRVLMDKAETAELFTDGGSQAVRLPKAFRLPGKEVRVRHFGRGVLLEPVDPNRKEVGAVFAEVDRLGGGEFLPSGRPPQPPMPQSDDLSFA